MPALRRLFVEIADASSGRTYLSDAAALAVSPNFLYQPFLLCNAGDGLCPTGRVQVRKSRDDAIHLDMKGNGARRFAHAMLADAIRLAS